jgi:hypothetical protein
MKLILLSIFSIVVICIFYKIFNWLLIKRDPIFNPTKEDRSLSKPNSFAHENKKLAQKGLKDQNKFTLTEVSKML